MNAHLACGESAARNRRPGWVFIIRRALLAIALVAGNSVSAGAAEVPAFLPPYYAEAFELGETTIDLVDPNQGGDANSASYSSNDGAYQLQVRRIPCQPSLCATLFENSLNSFNQLVSQSGGAFDMVEEDELVAHSDDIESSYLLIVVRQISSVQTWIYAVPRAYSRILAGKPAAIRLSADRQRYEEARSEGNVAMGHWGRQVLRYASGLLRAGEREAGIAVLREVVATSPDLYEAHAELFRNATDADTIRTSARIVFENAESIDLIREAASALGERLPQIGEFPVLEPNETGLQLILVPLPPVDPVFVAEAAALYSEAFGIPVKVRRLPEDWRFGQSNRIEQQRRAEEILVSLRGSNIDFSGWNLADYVANLKAALKGRTAIEQYHLRRFIDDIRIGEGQILINSHVTKLNSILKPFRSGDRRTMFVGVTRRNIYSGNNNYVFSLFGGHHDYSSSILSYSFMLAENLSQKHQSRRRLIERMAKELVPASLKALQIPRSTDPSCPYSYSSGVDRMDEKKLQLCPKVADAVEAFR